MENGNSVKPAPEKSYVIVTESTCDMPQTMADSMGILVAPIRVLMEGAEFLHYLDGRNYDLATFYEKVRQGVAAKTAAANPGDFMELMEPALAAGQDVLYIGFSTGLSSTYDNGLIAVQELREKYPARKILAVDSKAASLGQGLMVYHAAQMQAAGKPIEEVHAYLEGNWQRYCHWFTVDDLQHLKRGGRVSPAAAAFGTVLNIKPVLHVDDDGHLIPVSKVQGRMASIKALVKKMKELATDPAEQTVFISHGDCEAEALKLAEMVRAELGVKEIFINPIGPVIGAHSGPGTLALFFLGSKR